MGLVEVDMLSRVRSEIYSIISPCSVKHHISDGMKTGMEGEPFLEKAMPGLQAQKCKRRTCILTSFVVACLTVSIIIFQLGVRYGSSTGSVIHTSNSSDLGTVSSSQNATLGFGEIILLNLPERTDRRDAISLISSISGIEISKTLSAVKGEEVVDKARPIGNDKIDVAHLGSWRTHIDAFRYVVDNNIETALIFEDDVDWDVRMKSQMASFAAGMQAMSLRNHSATTEGAQYPYGMDWDILHLGASRIRGPQPPFDHVASIYADPARAKNPGCPNHFWKWFCWTEKLQDLKVPAGHRAIMPSYDSVGLPAIAVTYKGAQRLLLELSWVGAQDTLDFSIRDLLKEGKLQGWDVLPPIFSMWKLGTDADSDLEGAQDTNLHLGDVQPESQTDGSSPGIERSVRKEAARMLEDRKNEPNRWSKEYWTSLGVTF